MAAEQEIYVFSKRDEVESKRLDLQHKLVLGVFNGSLLHPIIPTSGIRSIADVGTGTGIWLEDLRSQILAQGSKLDSVRFDGFDISSAQFPKNGTCIYSLQDTLKPFPSQYHGLYDVVHIRCMIAAFTKDQFNHAAANLMQLLKPGGYIQWEEFAFEDTPANPPSPIHTELMDFICQTGVGGGMVEKVYREERNSYWYPELVPETKRWAIMGLTTAVPRAFFWSGDAKDGSSAAALAKVKLKQLQKEYSGGVVLNFDKG